VTIAFAIAAIVDPMWVDDKDGEASGQGQYTIGLYGWSVRNSANGNGGPFAYTTSCSDNGVFCWSNGLLGSQNSWRNAGKGAEGMGGIGVICAGLAVLLLLVNLCVASFSKFPAFFFAFLSGVSFLLGACIFEGMRPTWGGDTGYDYPMGLYLGAGIIAEVAAMLAWSADPILVVKSDVPLNNNQV